MPGVELDFHDKMEILRALDELGVDVIEAGFPASSEIDYKTVKTASQEASKAKIAALARAHPRDVDEAAAAEAHVIHVFIATSDVHLRYKLRMTRDQVMERAIEAIERARSYGATVLFSAEDATRSDLRFLVKVYRSVVEAGVGYINIPDTVGVATPWYMEWLVSLVKRSLPSRVWIDVHCHNDFGMATANTLAGVKAGANGVQVTVNGFGERAGNAALEEVVAALHYLLGRSTSVRMELLTPISQLVASKFGIKIPPNKAIVGYNAFAHESGIHVHGVLKNPATYEPLSPEAVGNRRRIVLGRHSGRASVEWALQNIGVDPEPALVEFILDKLKENAPRMKKVSEDVIIRWINEYMECCTGKSYQVHLS